MNKIEKIIYPNLSDEWDSCFKEFESLTGIKLSESSLCKIKSGESTPLEEWEKNQEKFKTLSQKVYSIPTPADTILLKDCPNCQSGANILTVSDEGEDNCVYCESCGLQFVDKWSECNDLAVIWNDLPRHKD